MIKNVLVLGANGMLGSMLKNILAKNKKIKMISTSRKIFFSDHFFDANDQINLLEKIIIKNKKISYIINCIGILNNQIKYRDISSIENAISINSLFPYRLASLAKKYDIKVIHMSTDAVFSESSKGCTEDIKSNCKDIYGKTKKLGEVNHPCFLNIRCSIIGPSPFLKNGILEWFISQPKKSKVYGFTNQNWNGVTTLQFAKLCENIIIENNFKKIRDENGVHHFCPNDLINKYQLLKLFKKWFRPDIHIIPKENPNSRILRFLKTNFHSIKDTYKGQNTIDEAIRALSKL